MKRSAYIFIVCALAWLCMLPPMSTISYAGSVSENKIEQLSKELNNMSNTTTINPLNQLLYLLSSEKDARITEGTKQIIKKQFDNNITRETILLAGFARIDSLLETIAGLAESPLTEPAVGRFFGTDGWAANLVMARQGDERSVKRLLDFASIQDAHTQVVFVAVDFQYVPQAGIVAYLKDILDSDDRLEPTKETVKGVPVANYAAFSLARILQGFPVKDKEDFSYSEEEIGACRKWMSQQKEWKFN
jgi:hypothetical protein